MRLLIISNLYEPDEAGGARIFADLSYGLAERGHDVTVYTTHPYYPEWRRKSADSPWRIAREERRGVHVWRHGIYVPTNPSRLVPRLLFELSFLASLLRSLWRGGKHDCVIVFCPMFSAVMFAAFRRMVTGETIWLNVQDLPAEAAASSGIGKPGLFARAARGLQSLFFNAASIWSTISPGMVDQLQRYVRYRQEVQFCPNWLHLSLASAIEAAQPRGTCRSTTPLQLLYSGNIGRKQGLLEACHLLASSQATYHLRIQGDGGEAPKLREWLVEAADARFSMSGLVSEPELAKAFHAADLTLITERPGPAPAFIPSKLIPAMAAGCPVVAMCEQESPLGREVQENGLGWIVSWETPTALPELLARLQREPQLIEAARAKCRARSVVYSREYGISRVEAILNQHGLTSPSTSAG